MVAVCNNILLGRKFVASFGNLFFFVSNSTEIRKVVNISGFYCFFYFSRFYILTGCCIFIVRSIEENNTGVHLYYIITSNLCSSVKLLLQLHPFKQSPKYIELSITLRQKCTVPSRVYYPKKVGAWIEKHHIKWNGILIVWSGTLLWGN